MFSGRGRIILTSATPPAGSVGTSQLAAQSVTLPKISRAGGSSGQVITHQGAGSDPAWATPSSGTPSVLSDALDGTGWDSNTATGSGVASWETAPARLRLTCPASGSAASCGVHAEGYVDSPVWGDLAIRLDVVVGDTLTTGRAGVVVGASSAENVSVNLWPNGNVECGHYGSGSFTSLATTAGPNSGQRTGGELWLKIGRTPTSVAFAWGVGSGGELPEQWTTTAISTDATVVSRASGTYVEVFGLTTTSAAVTVDVLDVKQGPPGAF